MCAVKLTFSPNKGIESVANARPSFPGKNSVKNEKGENSSPQNKNPLFKNEILPKGKRPHPVNFSKNVLKDQTVDSDLDSDGSGSEGEEEEMSSSSNDDLTTNKREKASIDMSDIQGDASSEEDAEYESDSEDMGSEDSQSEAPSEKNDDSQAHLTDSGMGNGDESVKRKAPQSAAVRRETKKQKTTERKQAKDSNYDLIAACKTAWSRLSSSIGRIEKEEDRHVHVGELIKLLDGNIFTCVSKRDGSHIIQACLKHGSLEQKTLILNEFLNDTKYSKTSLIDLAGNSYGRFVIWKLLKYAPTKELRSELRSRFDEHIIRMLRHRCACRIIDLMYIDYCTPSEQELFRETIYGPQFALYRAKQKDANRIITLDEIFRLEPAKKPFILAFMGKALLPLINKGTLQHVTFFHKSLREFLDHYTAQDSTLSLIYDRLRDQLVTILHTKEGSLVSSKCLDYYNNQDQAKVLVSMKPFIQKIFEDEFGHLVILKFLEKHEIEFDLVKSIILQKYLQSLEENLLHKFARKIALYLLFADKLEEKQGHFGGHQNVQVMHNATCDQNARKARIDLSLSYLLPNMMELSKGRCRTALLDSTQNVMLAEFIIYDVNALPEDYGRTTFGSLEDSQNALIDEVIRALSEQVQSDGTAEVNEDDGQPQPKRKKIFKDPTKEETPSTASAASKKWEPLMENITANRWTQKIIKAAATSSPAMKFVERFYSAIEPNLLQWATSRGSFVIVILAECTLIENKVLIELKKYLTELKKASKAGNAGAKILLGKLNKQSI